MDEISVAHSVMHKYLTDDDRNNNHSFQKLRDIALRNVAFEIAAKEAEITALKLKFHNHEYQINNTLSDSESAENMVLLVSAIKQHFILQQHMTRILVTVDY